MFDPYEGLPAADTAVSGPTGPLVPGPVWFVPSPLTVDNTWNGAQTFNGPATFAGGVTGAGGIALGVAATRTTAGALVVNKHNPIDATAAPLTMTLPTGQLQGSIIIAEKYDSTANAVTISGNIRGVPASTDVLVLAHQTTMFEADASGSWWPVSSHKALATLDGRYDGFDSLVVNVKNHGAKGDGTTDDTAAIQSAITLALTGGVVFFPPGTYKSGNLLVSGATNLTLRGPGATINWTGTAGGGSYIGIELTGACTNVRIVHLGLNGDGVTANGHCGVWNQTDAVLVDTHISRNRITNVVVGIYHGVGSSVSGAVTGFQIVGNRIDNVVGVNSGTGYGINVAGSLTLGPCNGFIDGNVTSRCQRHELYISQGSGYTVGTHTALNHRTGVATGATRCAVVLSRVSDVNVGQIVVLAGNDGALEVSTTAGNTCRNVAIGSLVVANPANVCPLVNIGTATPTTDGFPTEVSIANLSVYSTNASSHVVVMSGKRIRINGGVLSAIGVTSSTSMISIQGYQETAGTALYSDDISLSDMMLRGTDGGGGATYGIRLSGTETTAVRMSFKSLRINCADQSFATSANVTNPNLSIFDTPIDGITFSGVTGLVPIPESQVTNLTTDLAAKAADAAVVHTAGVETLTGVKTFSTDTKFAGRQINTAAGTPTIGSINANINTTSVTGNNVRGRVFFTTTATPPVVGSLLCQVIFSAAYAAAPVVITNKSDGNNGGVRIYNVAAGTFNLMVTAALDPSVVHSVDYMVMGTA